MEPTLVRAAGASALTRGALVATLAIGGAGAAFGAVYPLLALRVGHESLLAAPVRTFGLLALSIAPLFVRARLSTADAVGLRLWKHPLAFAVGFWSLWAALVCAREIDVERLRYEHVLPLEDAFAIALGASALLEAGLLHSLDRVSAGAVLRGPLVGLLSRAPVIERRRIRFGRWTPAPLRAIDLDLQRALVPGRVWVDYRARAAEPLRARLTDEVARRAVLLAGAAAFATMLATSAIAWVCLHRLSHGAALLGAAVSPTFAGRIASALLRRIAGGEGTPVRRRRAHVWIAWAVAVAPFALWVAVGGGDVQAPFEAAALCVSPVLVVAALLEVLGYSLVRIEEGTLHLHGIAGTCSASIDAICLLEPTPRRLVLLILREDTVRRLELFSFLGHHRTIARALAP